jgi:NAD(P)-dependent dehydrogenase (short-subunit alcohol dehydrogenase family)
VLVSARSLDKAEAAAAELRAGGADARPLELDVTDAESVARLSELERIDVLVNNAGIVPESSSSSTGDRDERTSALTASPEAVLRGFVTNSLGAYRVTQAVLPKMLEADYGRVVNVSSGMGQLSQMGDHYPGYRMSKAALNAFTRLLANELRGRNVLVNSVCPGWVKTDMGGPGARLSVEEGARGIVWAATLPDGGPTGGFFRHGKPIDW